MSLPDFLWERTNSIPFAVTRSPGLSCFCLAPNAELAHVCDFEPARLRLGAQPLALAWHRWGLEDTALANVPDFEPAGLAQVFELAARACLASLGHSKSASRTPLCSAGAREMAARTWPSTAAGSKWPLERAPEPQNARQVPLECALESRNA